MLEIHYKGGNSVNIATKKTTVQVDPAVDVIGLNNPKVATGIQLATEQRFLVQDSAALTLEGPGDYETAGVSIHGMPVQRHIDTADEVKKSTIYRLSTNDFSVGIIGNIDPTLSDEQYEGMGLVDILILPIGGGGYTLDAKSAAAIVRQIEPRAVIPVHYADSQLKYEMPQDSFELFSEEMNVVVEEVDSLKLKSVSNLPQVLTIYKMKRQ